MSFLKKCMLLSKLLIMNKLCYVLIRNGRICAVCCQVTQAIVPTAKFSLAKLMSTQSLIKGATLSGVKAIISTCHGYDAMLHIISRQQGQWAA